jgi:allantoin racemase
MRPILLINPNSSEATTAMMHGILRAALPAAIATISDTARRGPAMITTPAELAVAAEEVLRIGRARADEVSAIIVGAFGDPGLAALRAVVAIPVTGLGVASLRLAADGGRRFGVATTTPGLETSIARTVDRLGLTAFFTGTRLAAGDPLALANDPEQQEERLAQAVRTCIETDGAAAVVIGGGPLSAAAASLAPRFRVPVISAVEAAALEVSRQLVNAR